MSPSRDSETEKFEAIGQQSSTEGRQWLAGSHVRALTYSSEPSGSAVQPLLSARGIFFSGAAETVFGDTRWRRVKGYVEQLRASCSRAPRRRCSHGVQIRLSAPRRPGASPCDQSGHSLLQHQRLRVWTPGLVAFAGGIVAPCAPQALLRPRISTMEAVLLPVAGCAAPAVAALSKSAASRPQSCSSRPAQGIALKAGWRLQSGHPAPAAGARRLAVAALAAEGTAEAETFAEEGPADAGFAGSDEVLLLYFKAEGTLSEAAIPRVSKALEACEGVENVRVSVLDGCATVECTKTTTVQAAAVSSSLVEAIQSAGFGLQTVSLGFNDDGTETAAELFNVYTAEAGDLLADTSALGD